MSDVLFVSDMSGLSIWEIITANQSGHQDSAVVIQRVQVALRQPRYVWSADDHQIRAETTTCSFDNAGLTVALPTLGIPQLSASSQPGLTPFH